MSKNITFTNKVSPLIEGQVPDFVQSDHPLFVDFVKDYFKFLEAGRLTVENVVFYVREETNTINYILNEEGDRIVTETGDGTTGQFINGETITGGTSNATATVLVDDSRNDFLYISGQQKFENGETITGSTSGSTATITEYRGNPIQNIQQMLEYANVDNTLYDFLDQMRDQFMVSIPDNLVSSIDKRKLIKNIKDLYTVKGTSEGHKLFMRMLLDESSDVFYPTEYVMRTSDGNWENKITLRCLAQSGVEGNEVINQLITGSSSGATAIVLSSVVSQQSGIVGSTNYNDAVTEFEIASVVGTFTDGETITATSTTKDITVNFTVLGIVSEATIVNDGILYTDQEDITVEVTGNNTAELVVDGIKTGGISEVLVDDVGSGYEAGDILTFTATTADTDIDDATGFVSVIGGGIQLESGTLDDSTITDDLIIIEDATNTGLNAFNFQLEQTQKDFFRGDGETKVFTLVNTNASTDEITITFQNTKISATNVAGETVWTASGTTLTFTDAPVDGQHIIVEADIGLLLLDRTDTVGGVTGSGTTAVGGNDSGYKLESNTVVEEIDTYTTSSDQIVLEYDTLTTSQASSIRKVYITNSGSGYSALPTIDVTTIGGSSSKLLALTTDIGAVNDIKINNSGLRYKIANPPELSLNAHFIVKDVTGTFAENNTLTTHTGTVKSWDSTKNILETTFENVIRLVQEQDGTFNEGIQLEQGTELLTPAGILLEDEQDFDVDGDSIILNGSGTFTPSPSTQNYKVKIVAYEGANYFELNSVRAPIITLYEGNTYYFDLSDSSLYNVISSANHQLRFSETPDGTHGGGTAYTSGVTTSSASIKVGTTGAYIQIIVPTGSPTLYYYCVNHSGMGNTAYTSTYPTTVLDEGSNIVLNGTDRFDFNFLLEDENQDSGNTDKLQLEDDESGGAKTFLINEESLPATSAQAVANLNSEGKILLDRFRENLTSNANSAQFLLLNGTDANGSDDGSRVANEDFGNTLVLERTDSDGTDARDRLIFETDETGDGNIVLNNTDSDLNDAGDDIINESGIDFTNQNVTITDSSGASATIVLSDISTASTTVSVTATDVGKYRGISSLLGEDLNRLQDSYYYQDYSYEIRVGQSLSTYINDIKKAVHPAGFELFGKVTLATVVSAAVTNTAAGVSGYVGDTRTFSPILGSVLETIFSQVLQSRLQAPSTNTHDGQVAIGSQFDQIVQETGVLPGENIILDASASGTDVGSNLIFEDENLELELGSGKILLDGTDSDSANAGDNIRINLGTGFDLESGLTVSGDSLLYEEKTITHGDDETHGVGDGGGRIMAETSYAPSGNSDRLLITEKTIKPTPTLNRLNSRNILLYLAETPFGTTNGQCGISLESGSGNLTDNLVLDGTIPLNEGIAFFELERDTIVDSILLNGTDALETDSGDALLLETGFLLQVEDEHQSLINQGETFNILAEDEFEGSNYKIQVEADIISYPAGFIENDNDRIILDTNHNDETIPLSDISTFTFDDIRRRQRISISGPNGDETHYGGVTDEDDIVLENFGNILLDRTREPPDDASTDIPDDAGDKLLQETSQRNYFITEISGNLIVENNSTNSNLSRIIIEGTNNDVLLSNNFISDLVPQIKLEGEHDEGLILLDGTDNSSGNAGDNIILEDFFKIERAENLVYEDHNIFSSIGKIPVSNFTLNSSNVITKGHVRSSEILVRDTGDLSLEDATDSTHGFLVDETNGDNIDLEGATGITH